MAGTFSLMFPEPGQTIEVFSFFCSGVRFGSPKGEKRRGVLAKVDFALPEISTSGKRNNFGKGYTIWTAMGVKETVERVVRASGWEGESSHQETRCTYPFHAPKGAKEESGPGENDQANRGWIASIRSPGQLRRVFGATNPVGG